MGYINAESGEMFQLCPSLAIHSLKSKLLSDLGYDLLEG
jgi:hypothetical protein